MKIKSVLESIPDVFERRRVLATNVKGMGWKEASHFLRNTGFGENLAILDRHVLKNLVLSGVIPGIPHSLTPRRYFEIENRMKAFAKEILIPLAHLDFVLWYREAGDVFKCAGRPFYRATSFKILFFAPVAIFLFTLGRAKVYFGRFQSTGRSAGRLAHMTGGHGVGFKSSRPKLEFQSSISRESISLMEVTVI